MRIVYYSDVDLDVYSAPRNHVLSLCRELADLGHEVNLLAWRPKVSVPASSFRMFFVPHALLGWHLPFQDRLRKLHGRMAVALTKPDVIYERESGGDLSPVEMADRWGIPRVVELNGWLPNDVKLFGGNDDDVRHSVRVLKRHLETADAVISTSPGVRTLAIQVFDLPPGKVLHIANGVDVGRFDPQDRLPHSPEKRFVVGFVGSSHPHHDVPTLLRATKMARDRGIPVHLRIIGKAASVADWHELARQLDINQIVRFIEAIPPERLPKELRKMSVCVVPYSLQMINQSDGATAATKLWEYWASKRPVIATDLHGSSSYVHHVERRYLAVPPESPEDMADAIEQLYSNPHYAEELAQNGYVYVRDGHSWKDVARRVEEVLISVVEQRNHTNLAA